LQASKCAISLFFAAKQLKLVLMHVHNTDTLEESGERDPPVTITSGHGDRLSKNFLVCLKKSGESGRKKSAGQNVHVAV
jgi:hypothetical protein